MKERVKLSLLNSPSTFHCLFQENSTDEAKLDVNSVGSSLRPEPSPGSVSSRSNTPASVSGMSFLMIWCVGTDVWFVKARLLWFKP